MCDPIPLALHEYKLVNQLQKRGRIPLFFKRKYLCVNFLVERVQHFSAAWKVGSKHNRLNLQTWSSSVTCGSPRHACQGWTQRSNSTSKHGNGCGVWLHTPVTEPKSKTKLCHQFVTLCREGPGNCFTISGLLSVSFLVSTLRFV